MNTNQRDPAGDSSLLVERIIQNEPRAGTGCEAGSIVTLEIEFRGPLGSNYLSQRSITVSAASRIKKGARQRPSNPRLMRSESDREPHAHFPKGALLVEVIDITVRKPLKDISSLIVQTGTHHLLGKELRLVLLTPIAV